MPESDRVLDEVVSKTWVSRNEPKAVVEADRVLARQLGIGWAEELEKKQPLQEGAGSVDQAWIAGWRAAAHHIRRICKGDRDA